MLLPLYYAFITNTHTHTPTRFLYGFIKYNLVARKLLEYYSGYKIAVYGQCAYIPMINGKLTLFRTVTTLQSICINFHVYVDLDT